MNGLRRYIHRLRTLIWVIHRLRTLFRAWHCADFFFQESTAHTDYFERNYTEDEQLFMARTHTLITHSQARTHPYLYRNSWSRLYTDRTIVTSLYSLWERWHYTGWHFLGYFLSFFSLYTDHIGSRTLKTYHKNTAILNSLPNYQFPMHSMSIHT